MTRGQLLTRTAVGGLALAGLAAAPASAGIGQPDIPVVTLALAAELLGAELYTQALGAKVFDAEVSHYLRRAQRNEAEHYAALAKILTDAGQTPGQASDFDFTFPATAFATRKGAAELGLRLETALVGIHLGGAASLQDPVTRSVFARIAASQSQHLSVFSRIVMDRPIGVAFPPALSLEDGSTAIDPFIS